MKTLLSIVFIYLFGSFVISADSIPHHETEGPDEYDILRHSIPDSIYDLLQEKPFFAQLFGHHGHSWALFTRNDRDSIVIYYGYHGNSEYRKYRAEENKNIK